MLIFSNRAIDWDGTVRMFIHLYGLKLLEYVECLKAIAL